MRRPQELAIRLGIHEATGYRRAFCEGIGAVDLRSASYAAGEGTGDWVAITLFDGRRSSGSCATRASRQGRSGSVTGSGRHRVALRERAQRLNETSGRSVEVGLSAWTTLQEADLVRPKRLTLDQSSTMIR